MDKYKFSRLNANGTTVVKTGHGRLHSVSINTAGASSNTLTIYDGTSASGTPIAAYNTTAANCPTCFIYDIGFVTGLTAVLATGTAADVTITYS